MRRVSALGSNLEAAIEYSSRGIRSLNRAWPTGRALALPVALFVNQELYGLGVGDAGDDGGDAVGAGGGGLGWRSV